MQGHASAGGEGEDDAASATRGEEAEKQHIVVKVGMVGDAQIGASPRRGLGCWRARARPPAAHRNPCPFFARQTTRAGARVLTVRLCRCAVQARPA